MKTGQIFAGIILSLVLIICQIVPAQAVPPIPSSFWGTVTINGHVIPVSQNLYLGQYIDEYELGSKPWLLF